VETKYSLQSIKFEDSLWMRTLLDSRRQIISNHYEISNALVMWMTTFNTSQIMMIILSPNWTVLSYGILRSSWIDWHSFECQPLYRQLSMKLHLDFINRNSSLLEHFVSALLWPIVILWDHDFIAVLLLSNRTVPVPKYTHSIVICDYVLCSQERHKSGAAINQCCASESLGTNES
jgi:hypothetical protein